MSPQTTPGARQALPDGTARPHYPALPLPEWVMSLRETQVAAVREAVELFREGNDVVFMDAPVGSGKTLIGELVRRELNIQRGLYSCSDKALQDQVVRDFAYARVLKGRANYIPLNARDSVTCEDCTLDGGGNSCWWCPDARDCPYLIAKDAALGVRSQGELTGFPQLAVLNTAYLLTAGNRARTLQPRYPLIIADEADMLEAALIGFIEYRVPEWIGRLLHLTYPRKAARKPTLVSWLDEAANAATLWLADHPAELDAKQRRRLASWAVETKITAQHLQLDVDAAAGHADDDSDEDSAGRWIRDYGSDYRPERTLKLRPVTVSHYGAKNLWRHGERWLCMSGTLISSDEMADSLGLPLKYATVEVPSTFPVERRPIILAPVANVTRQMPDSGFDDLAYAIEQIAERHDGRILVHTVSYKLARELHSRCHMPSRHAVIYLQAADKTWAMDEYLSHPNSVLFAASMQRGVDLAGDKCAVQIIAKCPFPNLGDKQVSSRLRLPGGQQWYAVNAVREIVQMTGRGMRSETDACTTYILDQQFVRNLWAKNKSLFPRYFTEAVRATDDVRWLVRSLSTASRHR